jgi:hypothetical protein
LYLQARRRARRAGAQDTAVVIGGEGGEMVGGEAGEVVAAESAM